MLEGLKDSVLEYFLGARTQREFNYLRAMHREFCLCDYRIHEFNRESSSAENRWLRIEKTMPNLLDIAGVSLAMVTRNPYYLGLAGIGEGLRYFFKDGANINYFRDRVSNIRDRHFWYEELKEERKASQTASSDEREDFDTSDFFEDDSDDDYE